MPTVTFESDARTGQMTVDINGIVGPACDNILKLIEELTGAPGTIEQKPEYHQRVVSTRRVGR